MLVPKTHCVGLSNPRAIKLKLFGTTFYDTGNFNEHRRREGARGVWGHVQQKILKSESLKTQFPALSGQ